MKLRSWIPTAAALGLALGLGACVNDDSRLYEVHLRGSVSLDGGAEAPGRVILELRHRSSGEGTLAYPLRPITELELDGLGAFDETFLVPVDEGEGLIAYAWLDSDGDGTLCAPEGDAGEPAGLVEVEGFPAHELEVDLVLSKPCAGAEILWP